MITVAKTAGFCFGVSRAVKIAYEVAEKNGGCTLGPIIHNKEMVSELAEKGVKAVDSIEEIGDNTPVIIRSHGAGRSVYDAAKAKGIELIDATCPFVEKIHRIVSETDRQVVIAGDPDHAEVKGIAGWCPTDRPAIVCRTAEEAAGAALLLREKLREKAGEILLVAQTTIKEETDKQLASAAVKAMVDAGKITADSFAGVITDIVAGKTKGRENPDGDEQLIHGDHGTAD